jgi:predicted Na+-dependent transporter
VKRIVARFGKLITASFFVMGIGIILFLLTIPLYANINTDTDILGLVVFAVGLALLIFGVIIRKKLRGWKLVILIVVAAFLLMPLLPLIVSLIYYLITGQPLGS